MRSTTSFEFGDVVLVPFPFADQTGTKKRPAVVASTKVYNDHRPDVVIFAITSQGVGEGAYYGDTEIHGWRAAGLLKASLIKPVLATVQKHLVLRKLGRLGDVDLNALRGLIVQVFGSQA
jgi:mRNA interferase MazF